MQYEYFHFKDFSMRQSPSGQRINTDSIVFADLVIQRLARDAQSILDVGAGSGVLSCMLASSNRHQSITAIEPETDAFSTLSLNCSDDQWRGHIKAECTTLQKFLTNEKFDVLICNPPFFTTGPRALEKTRAAARHNDLLSPSDLSHHAHRVMRSSGQAFIVSDVDGSTQWCAAMHSESFQLIETVLLADSPESKPHAIVHCFTRNDSAVACINSRFNYRTKRGGDYSQGMQNIRTRWLHPRHI